MQFIFLEITENLERYSSSEWILKIPVNDRTTNQDVYNRIEDIVAGNSDSESAFDQFLERETEYKVNPKNEFLEDNHFHYESGKPVFAIFRLKY